MRRFTEHRPQGRTYRRRALALAIRTGELSKRIAERQFAALRRAQRQKNPWMRKDWKHDQARLDAAVARRARRCEYVTWGSDDE